MTRLWAFPLLASVAGFAHAAEQSGASTAGSLARVLFGLVAVLALMAATAWLLRRCGASRTTGAGTIKVVGGVSVGSRERIMVVEIGGQWLVVGVAPGRINALTSMPCQPDTATPA